MKIQLIRADITSMKVDAMVSPSASDEDTSSGGNLLCKFVIHAAVPAYGSDDAEERLRRSIERALERAEELALASIAIPPMWLNPPEALERGARIVLTAALAYAPRARSLQRVVFMAIGEEVHRTFERVRQEVDPS